MDEMMETYAHFDSEKNKTSWSPLLQKLKREICHDKDRFLKEIDETIELLVNNRFHFYHLTPMEQLYVFGMDGFDPIRKFAEDIGVLGWSNYQMINCLHQLKNWLKKAPKYEYPVEYYTRIEKEL